MKGKILGIDIGGSGVKGAIVDVSRGEFVGERLRIPTPATHTPAAILDCIGSIISAFNYSGKIGCGFPGVIRSQIIETAANIGGKNFIGVNLAEMIGLNYGCEAWLLNDADAAGMAEMRYGAGKGVNGVVAVLTVGTGIGVSMFVGGRLVPNLEFGHLKMREKKTGRNIDAEKLYSDAARKRVDMLWKTWASGFSKFLKYFHSLTRPDLIIIGGGVASKSDKFLKYLEVDCDIKIAQLQNRAGIIGAAYCASTSIK